MRTSGPCSRCARAIATCQRPPFECIALVLQGGGALGAFQAGVYQAMAEAELHPDWVSGISIGAINAALIAGNAPHSRLDKLRAFWELVSTPHVPDFFGFAEHCAARRSGARLPQSAACRRRPAARGAGILHAANAAALSLSAGHDWRRPAGTTPSRCAPRWSGWSTSTASISARCAFSVGAVNIRSGNFVYFDSTTHKIRPEHVMASGALPPGFPPVEIDGELYWDGGLVSNTPLQWVVAGDTRQDTLAFQVDLWSARGEVPGDLQRRLGETKGDPVFEPHARQHRPVQDHPTRALRACQHYGQASAGAPATARTARSCKSVADRKVYQIVHLIYRSKHYEVQSKDYEFSRNSMTRSLERRIQRRHPHLAPSGSPAAPNRPLRGRHLRPRRQRPRIAGPQTNCPTRSAA